MRTDEEIIARIAEVDKRDFFGFETSDLVVRLPFEKAKPFLKDDAKAEEWKVDPAIVSLCSKRCTATWSSHGAKPTTCVDSVLGAHSVTTKPGSGWPVTT